MKKVLKDSEKLMEVSPPSKEQNIEDYEFIRNGKAMQSGNTLPIGKIWEYIPFNSIEPNDQRAQALQKGLQQLCCKYYGNTWDLERLLHDHLDEVKKEYHNIFYFLKK